MRTALRKMGLWMTNPKSSISARLSSNVISCQHWCKVRHGPYRNNVTALKAFKLWILRRMLRTKLDIAYHIFVSRLPKSNCFIQYRRKSYPFRAYRETQFRCKDVRWKAWSRERPEEGDQDNNRVTISRNVWIPHSLKQH